MVDFPPPLSLVDVPPADVRRPGCAGCLGCLLAILIVVFIIAAVCIAFLLFVASHRGN